MAVRVVSSSTLEWIGTAPGIVTSNLVRVIHTVRQKMNPSQYIIRKAQGADAEAIQRLYTSFINDPRIKVDPEQVGHMFNSKHSHLLLYEAGEIYGTVLVSLCEDAMYQSQPFAVVENIVVLDSRRNKGIGSCLLEYVDSLCLALDCSKIMLSSSAARIDAHRFFISHGYNGDSKKGFVKYRNAFTKLTPSRFVQPTA